MQNRHMSVFERFSSWATLWTGSSWAFALAIGCILVWVVTGPLFGFSDTWQLVINTSTTIVTFLMVFLIQHTQNKDSVAIQLKLNEVVAALGGASNRLINVEDLTEEEVRALHDRYRTLSSATCNSAHLTESHSIEETESKREKQRSQSNHKKQSPPKANARRGRSRRSPNR